MAFLISNQAVHKGGQYKVKYHQVYVQLKKITTWKSKSYEWLFIYVKNFVEHE